MAIKYKTNQKKHINTIPLGTTINSVIPFIHPYYDARSEKIVGGHIICRVKKQNGYNLKQFHIDVNQPTEDTDFYVTQLLLKTSDYLKSDKLILNSGFIFIMTVMERHLLSPLIADAITDFSRVIGSDIKLWFENVNKIKNTESIKPYVLINKNDNQRVQFAVDCHNSYYSSAITLDKQYTKMQNDKLVYLDFIKKVVKTASSRELIVIAEGVDSETQAQALTDLNIVVMQGKFYSGPVSMSEFSALYIKSKHKCRR